MTYLTLDMLRATSPKAAAAFDQTGLTKTFSLARHAGITNLMPLPASPEDDPADPAEQEVPCEIVIYDAIGTFETNAQTFKAALDACAGAPLTLRLASPGGSFEQGLAMYNILRDYTGLTTAVVDGSLASIATVLALGADQVLTANASIWMIHSASTLAYGNSEDLRKTAAVLDMADSTISGVYASKAGNLPGDWAAIMAEETYFTSSDVIAMGLADGIYTPAPKSEAAVSASADIQITAAADQVRLLQLRAKAASMAGA